MALSIKIKEILKSKIFKNPIITDLIKEKINKGKWKVIIKIIAVMIILFTISFVFRSINEYNVNKYQEKFERNDEGVIEGMNRIYLEGQNDKAVVLIHGFTDSPNNMRELAEVLNQKGYSVYVPLLPGHGTTIQDLNSKEYSSWYRAASNSFEDADEEEVYLIGYSLGGLLALDIASRNEIKAVITINAPIKLKSKYVYFAPILRIFEDYHIKDKESMNELIENGLTVPYNAFPLKGVLGLLEGIKKLKLENIDEPTIVIQGIDDGVVDRDSAIIIYDKINSKNKKLLFLEDSTHAIINNKDKGFGEILDFISDN